MTVLYLADIRLPLERANGIQTMETCHALARRGHDLTLLVRPDTQSPARDPLAFYDLPAIDTLTIARVPVRGPAPLRRVRYLTGALAQALRAPRVDVVLTRDLGVASLLLRGPQSARPPVVYESHGYAPVVTGLLPELLTGAPAASRAKARRLASRERRVWAHADAYVTITAALADELRTRLGPRPARPVIDDGMPVDHDLRARFGDAVAKNPRLPVHVIPDGARVDPGRRFDWTGPSASPVVMYAGHLYPWKGVETLLAALAAAPGLRARIVGGHPSEPDLARVRGVADTLGLGDRVEFTGMKPPGEVAASLREADLLVLPNRATTISASYTSPLKLFEYLAAGRPIIASDLPALREVLTDRENAWLVPPDDPGALAQALTALAQDRQQALRLARAAFELAVDYSWDRRAERLEDALLQAVRNGARR